MCFLFSDECLRKMWLVTTKDGLPAEFRNGKLKKMQYQINKKITECVRNQ